MYGLRDINRRTTCVYIFPLSLFIGKFSCWQTVAPNSHDILQEIAEFCRRPCARALFQNTRLFSCNGDDGDERLGHPGEPVCSPTWQFANSQAIIFGRRHLIKKTYKHI